MYDFLRNPLVEQKEKNRQAMGDVTPEIPEVSDPEDRIAGNLHLLFNGEINPVAPKAQKKVPIPEGYKSQQ